MAVAPIVFSDSLLDPLENNKRLAPTGLWCLYTPNKKAQVIDALRVTSVGSIELSSPARIPSSTHLVSSRIPSSNTRVGHPRSNARSRVARNDACAFVDAARTSPWCYSFAKKIASTRTSRRTCLRQVTMACRSLNSATRRVNGGVTRNVRTCKYDRTRP